MMFEEYKKFQEYASKFNNVYSAINYIANQSRNLTKSTNNLILDSEAISWFLTGEKPSILSDIDKIKKQNRKKIVHITDILSYVDDISVCESAMTSLRVSKQAGYLIYVYKDVPDEDRQARVRVLTRILWYNSTNILGGNNIE